MESTPCRVFAQRGHSKPETEARAPKSDMWRIHLFQGQEQIKAWMTMEKHAYNIVGDACACIVARMELPGQSSDAPGLSRKLLLHSQ
jgi:hypothetical protein